MAIDSGSDRLIEVVIDGLSDDGRGVARIDGKVAFVDDALPGETVLFRPARRKRRYDTGLAVKRLVSSVHRVTPRCEYFGVCGGCAMQHVSTEAQIQHKQARLVDALQRIGGVAAERLLPPLCGQVWGYRCKARLGIRFVPKKGGVLVGFRERRKSYITPLDHCEVLHPRIAVLLAPLHRLVAALSCYDRLPQIEVAVGDADAALVFRHLEPLNTGDIDKLEKFAAEHRVQVYRQPGDLESVTPLFPVAPRPLTYTLDEFQITHRFAPTDFIQVNAGLNRNLVSTVVRWLNPQPGDWILDLFCGLGNFTLPLARLAGHVTGIEGAPAMVGRALENAQHNSIDNVSFFTADLFQSDVAGSWLHDGYSKILLDPPRSGAIEFVKRIPALAPERLVYVSCNPETLARDADFLVKKARFRLVAAGVIDMFPHTAHVESLAVFEPH